MNFICLASGWYLNLFDIETLEPTENDAGFFVTLRSGHVKHLSQEEGRNVLQAIEANNERSIIPPEKQSFVSIFNKDGIKVFEKKLPQFIDNSGNVEISYSGYKIGKEKYGQPPEWGAGPKIDIDQLNESVKKDIAALNFHYAAPKFVGQPIDDNRPDGSESAGAEPGADGGEVSGDDQAGAHGAD